MAVGTNRWKLGLFVLVGFGLAVAALVAFGARNWSDETLDYFAFFDESVQGLDAGSPVKFRGVTIGRVAAIDVAPDHRHVEVELELSEDKLERLNLGLLRRPQDGALARSKLRVQLAQTGITGVKFILLDFFEGKAAASPALPFRAPPNTIASTPSTMKNLEDSVVRAVDQFPEVAAALLGTINRVNSLLDGVDQQGLAARAAATLDAANATLKELRGQVEALRTAELSAQAEKDLVQLEQTLKGVDRIVARLDAEDGVMRNAERASNSLNEVARGAQTVGPELELTLREVRAAARSIRRFTDTLERDPDMLLKGRAALP
ncbi:MAG TPA: MlaD family protein [Polyangiaceae bacterium]